MRGSPSYDTEMKTRAVHGIGEGTCRTGTFTRYNISRGGTIEQTNFELAATPEIHHDITIESFINRT